MLESISLRKSNAFIGESISSTNEKEATAESGNANTSRCAPQSRGRPLERQLRHQAVTCESMHLAKCWNKGRKMCKYA